ncbi:MAG: DUF4131 domain-containing protein, partial [Oscillospiraceae bacterium]|nr:DUF4131 domain-containing protein [Oscillospiraceae bacterium]
MWVVLCVAVCGLLGVLSILIRKLPRFAPLIFIGAAVGFLCFFVFNRLMLPPVNEMVSSPGEYTAVVRDFPVSTTGGIRLTASVDTGGVIKPRTYVYIYSSGAPDYSPGDVITLEGKYSLSDTIRGSETDVFTSKGVFVLARTSTAPEIIGKKPRLLFAHMYVRRYLKDKISEIFPAGQAPFMTALLLGDRTQLNEDTALTAAMS